MEETILAWKIDQTRGLETKSPCFRLQHREVLVCRFSSQRLKAVDEGNTRNYVGKDETHSLAPGGLDSTPERVR